MRIQKIRVENFGKYKEKEFEIEDGKLYVVMGRNGVGKSTLFVESLGWCFYGDMWRGGQRDDVIRDGEEWCKVVISSDVGVIERYRERGKGSVVKVNGRVCGDVDVVNLIKLNKDMFFNSVVFGSAMSGFLFLSDGERREMLAEIVYKELDDVIVKLKEYKKDVNVSVVNKGKELEYVRMQLERVINKLSSVGDGENVDELRCRIRKEESRFRELEKEKERLEKELAECLVDVERLMDSNERLEKVYRDKDKLLWGKKKELENMIEKLKKIEKMSVCVSCGQEVSKEHKEVLINRVLEDMKKLEEEVNGLDKEVGEIGEELLKVKRDIGELKRKEGVLKKKIDSVVSELFDVQDVINRNRMKLVKVTEIAKLRLEYELEKKDLEKVKEGLEKELDELKVEEQACGYWVDVFTRYKVELFDKVVDVLGVVANEILMKLSDGRFRVDVGMDVKGKKRVGEKFILDLYDGDNRVVYNRLSGGEKRLVVLGLNLALNYVLSRVYADDWNVMVFDEVFDALDVGVREKVTDLLLEMVQRTGKAIIVITHDEFVYREGEFEKVVVGV